MSDIVKRLLQHFDADQCMEDPGLVMEAYRSERIEAAREIAALRRRLRAAGISTAGDLPADPKVIRLHR